MGEWDFPLGCESEGWVLDVERSDFSALGFVLSLLREES